MIFLILLSLDKGLFCSYRADYRHMCELRIKCKERDPLFVRITIDNGHEENKT